MKKPLQNKAFKIGIIGGGLLSVLINYFDYLSTWGNFYCADCILSFGFPFALYEEGGFIDIKRFYGLV